MLVPRLAALLAAAAASLAVPSTAAAELTVSKPDATTVLVTETAIGTDRITVDTTADTVTVTPQELSDGLTAGDGCEEAVSGAVTCSAAGVEKVSIQLGFGDDALLAGTGTLRREVDGRYGQDVIHDQPGDDLLEGGTDDDSFVMHSGDDVVVAAADYEPNASRDYDTLIYSSYGEGVEVTLSDTVATTGNGATGEDDTISGVEHIHGGPGDDHLVGSDTYNFLYGGDGADTIEGNGGGDSLYGDDSYGGGDNDDELYGGAGRDRVWAQGGSDVLDGGADGDMLNAVDDPLQADQSIDCGDGADDTLNADNLTDPEPAGCEVVAPEFYEGPEIVAFDEFMEGHWAAIGGFSITGGSEDDRIEVEWWRCRWDEMDCSLRLTSDQPAYELTDEDVDSVLYAVVRVSNDAGSDEFITGDTPLIAPAPFVVVDPIGGPQVPRPPAPGVVVLPPGPGPYADYGDYADTLEQRLAPLQASLGGALRTLARRWDGDDPRTLARRRFIAHRLTFPDTGRLSLTWTATTGGARAAASRRVTIARGAAGATKGATTTVRVRPTKRGRALLRRAKSLRVTVSATFVGGAATAAAPAEAKRTFRLKRR